MPGSYQQCLFEDLFFIYFFLQIPDDEGGQSKLVIWSYPGSDVTGMLARCDKVVSTCEKVCQSFTNHITQDNVRSFLKS